MVKRTHQNRNYNIRRGHQRAKRQRAHVQRRTESESFADSCHDSGTILVLQQDRQLFQALNLCMTSSCMFQLNCDLQVSRCTMLHLTLLRRWQQQQQQQALLLCLGVNSATATATAAVTHSLLLVADQTELQPFCCEEAGSFLMHAQTSAQNCCCCSCGCCVIFCLKGTNAVVSLQHIHSSEEHHFVTRRSEMPLLYALHVANRGTSKWGHSNHLGHFEWKTTVPCAELAAAAPYREFVAE